MSLVNFSGVNVAEFTITGFDHLPYQPLLGVLVLLAYFLILLLNGTNILLITTDQRLHQPMYLLICNLAVVDIMFTTTASTTMIGILLAHVKTVSYYSCISRMYIYHFGDLNECFALALMALDRILAITNPLRYNTMLTVPRVCILIAVPWILSIGLIARSAVDVDRMPFCQPIIRYVFCEFPAMVRAACVDPEPYFLFSAIVGVIVLGVMFPLILLSYIKILYTVLRLSQTKGRAQAFNTVISHLITMMSFYIPKLISILLTRVGVRLDLTERNALQIMATLVPPLINPTVYCLRTKEIRLRLVHFLTRNKTEPVK